LEQYLPEPFAIDGEPLVYVSATMNRQVDWLAGAPYNLIGVNVPVVFNGETDKDLHGTYCLVMWENDTDPIIAGRELLGIPKIYADIQDFSILGDEYRVSASLRGHKIMDMEIVGLKAVPEKELEERRKNARPGNWFGWRYMPNCGEPGAALSHAVCNPTGGGGPKAAWTGQGKIEWPHLTWEQNPAQCHIVNALRDLPIIEYRHAGVTLAGSSLEPDGRKLRAVY